MKIIHDIHKLKKIHNAVVALGVFDGMHLAHQQILREAVKKAKAIHGISIVVTFWPHPQKEPSLVSLGHRLKMISEMGIDTCLVINFTPSFANMAAEDFIDDILVKRIAARHIYVGKNFRFGKGAAGNYQLLAKLSKAYGYKLKLFSVIKVKGQPISSTYIRKLITRGELKTAQHLLGRPVGVLGSVVKGISLGKRIGFPTANIDPHHEILPPAGIYAVRILLAKNKLNGVCYIGSKPTLPRKHLFYSKKDRYIEVYIFDFNKNIYGSYLEMQFVKKIRKEKKFRSLVFLKKQIKKDISRAKIILSLH